MYEQWLKLDSLAIYELEELLLRVETWWYHWRDRHDPVPDDSHLGECSSRLSLGWAYESVRLLLLRINCQVGFAPGFDFPVHKLGPVIVDAMERVELAVGQRHIPPTSVAWG
jgi:hypothetical protein